MKSLLYKVKLAIFVSFFFLPSTTVLAQSAGVGLARDFVGKINEYILFPLITLMLAIAVLVFLYGAFEYVARSDNESAREQGRTHLLWGIVGLLVMVSALAILSIAANTFEPMIQTGSQLDQSIQ